MFNRCRLWRHRLNKLADNEITSGELAALQEHLLHCSRCRTLCEADNVRLDVLGQHTGMLSDAHAKDFDNCVVAALRVGPPSSGHPALGFSWRMMWSRWNALSFEFLQQMAGGAIAAATVTLICLFSSLHPKMVENRPETGPPVAIRNEPPVPLESLAHVRSPQAALLWSAPNHGGIRVAPVIHRPRPKNAGRQGAIIELSTLG